MDRFRRGSRAQFLSDANARFMADSDSLATEISDDDCPLATGEQTRNILCFAGLWCCYYLVAPVSYVGVTHANLLKSLGSSDTVANLPHAFFQWTSALPVLVAWF